MRSKQIYPRPVPSGEMEALYQYFKRWEPYCEVCHNRKATSYSEVYDLLLCKECSDRKTAWMTARTLPEEVQEEFTRMTRMIGG